MSERDAYLDEMTMTGPKDEELDGIYAGIAPSESLAEVASFMVEVKSTLASGPSDATARDHLSAIVAQAREVSAPRPLPANQDVFAAGPTAWRRVMDKMIATLAKGAAGVLAASMSMMGLAYAGVDLPGQSAERALEAVTGVTLPNQGDQGSSVDDAVKAVVESDAEKGCEFGQAVAAAASQRDGDSEACSADDDTEAKGSRATGTEKSAKGRATAAEKSADGSAAATENSDGRSDAGADNAATGEATAAESSGGAADAGAGNASEGESTAGEQSGGASEGGRPEGTGDAGDAGDDEAAAGPSNADAGSDAAAEAGAPEEIPTGRP